MAPNDVIALKQFSHTLGIAVLKKSESDLKLKQISIQVSSRCYLKQAMTLVGFAIDNRRTDYVLVGMQRGKI